MKAGLVYKLNCNDCSSSYVGETGGLLKEKLNEHKEDIEKCMQKYSWAHFRWGTNHG